MHNEILVVFGSPAPQEVLRTKKTGLVLQRPTTAFKRIPKGALETESSLYTFL